MRNKSFGLLYGVSLILVLPGPGCYQALANNIETRASIVRNISSVPKFVFSGTERLRESALLENPQEIEFLQGFEQNLAMPAVVKEAMDDALLVPSGSLGLKSISAIVRTETSEGGDLLRPSGIPPNASRFPGKMPLINKLYNTVEFLSPRHVGTNLAEWSRAFFDRSSPQRRSSSPSVEGPGLESGGQSSRSYGIQKFSSHPNETVESHQEIPPSPVPSTPGSDNNSEEKNNRMLVKGLIFFVLLPLGLALLNAGIEHWILAQAKELVIAAGRDKPFGAIFNYYSHIFPHVKPVALHVLSNKDALIVLRGKSFPLPALHYVSYASFLLRIALAYAVSRIAHSSAGSSGEQRILYAGSALFRAGFLLNLIDVIRFHGVLDYVPWPILYGAVSPGDIAILLGIAIPTIYSAYISLRKQLKKEN